MVMIFEFLKEKYVNKRPRKRNLSVMSTFRIKRMNIFSRFCYETMKCNALEFFVTKYFC